MHNSKINLDQKASCIFNFPVVDWTVNTKLLTPKLLQDIEFKIIQEYKPEILSVFLTSPTPEKINLFIKAGFEFIQSRLSLEKTISAQHVNFYPFELVLVTEEKQLDELIQLCSGIEFDDRFSIDPVIKPEKALQRNIYFLKESFKKKDEFVFLLINNTQKTVCGFRSFKTDKNHTASMFLSGITRKDNLFDYAGIICYLELQALDYLNIKKVKSVISINNFEEINRYIAELGYKVFNSNTVMRKFYQV